MLIIGEIIIENKKGLHARPSSALVKITNLFDSSIKISKDGITVNGKSIMSLMTLAASKGQTLIVEIDGNDAKEAMEAIQFLAKNKFNES